MKKVIQFHLFIDIEDICIIFLYRINDLLPDEIRNIIKLYEEENIFQNDKEKLINSIKDEVLFYII